MGKAIAVKSRIVQKEADSRRKNEPSSGTKTERKLNVEMKRLRQQIVRGSNDISKNSKEEINSLRKGTIEQT